jgi:hypothetical protein
MTTIRATPTSLRSIAIAVLGAVAVTGCGSTGPLSGTVTNSPSGPNHAFEFSQCMRAKGVPNFPDPGPNGYRLGPGSGIDLSSPAAESAMKACEKYLNQTGHPPPVPANVQRQELELASCMRANGVPNFPDPDANGDIQFPVDSPIPRSPAFRRAQSACKKYVPGR